MPLVIVDDADTLPVSLADAKLQCRILDADTTHDTRLTEYIWAAVGSIERLTGAVLATKTIRLDMDGFPDGEIDLGVYPVTSVTSVTYDDADNAAQTLTTSPVQYWESLGGMYPKISPVESWPQTRSGKIASVRVTMVTGYGGTLPRDLKHAVLMRVSEYFNNSAESVTGSEVFATVNTVESLISQWRRVV